MTPDMLVARFSEIDADGFIGIQVDNYGEQAAEFGTVEAHHPFGFMARPRDPDVDGQGEVKLGCTALRLAEGNESHAILLGDPRATSKLPALKKGGSVHYGFTGSAVSYAMFDGDDGSYLLRAHGVHVDLSESGDVMAVGTAPPSLAAVAIATKVAEAFSAVNTAHQAIGVFATAIAGLAGAPGLATTLNAALAAVLAQLTTLAGTYPAGYTATRLTAQ